RARESDLLDGLAVAGQVRRSVRLVDRHDEGVRDEGVQPSAHEVSADLHLHEAVTRVQVTEPGRTVGRRGALHVRDAVLVDRDAHIGADAVELDDVAWPRGAFVIGAARSERRRTEQEGERARAQPRELEHRGTSSLPEARTAPSAAAGLAIRASTSNDNTRR